MKIKRITNVGKRPVYDISVKDVEHYILENGVVTHNTGIMYSADQVFITSRKLDDESKSNDVHGYEFTIRVEKSRFTREGSRLSFSVNFDQGVNSYPGLFALATEAGIIVSPKMGWYAKVDDETGEIIEKNYRKKDCMNEDFFADILQSEKFNNYIKENYRLN